MKNKWYWRGSISEGLIHGTSHQYNQKGDLIIKSASIAIVQESASGILIVKNEVLPVNFPHWRFAREYAERVL